MGEVESHKGWLSALAPAANRRASAANRRGFTLAELLIVVVIMGVLAAAASYGVRKYILYAKSGEGREIIGAIMAGQAAYYDETFQFLDISAASAANWYPRSEHDGTIKTQWGAAQNCAGGFSCPALYGTLGVTPSAPVLFDYQTTADDGSAAPSALLLETATGPFGTATAPGRPQFVVEAAAALDGNTANGMTIFVGSSHSSEIWGTDIGN